MGPPRFLPKHCHCHGCTGRDRCLHYFLLSRSVIVFLFLFLTPRLSLGCPGALFTHWIVDSLTLWKSPVTDEHLWTAASYYSILTKGPPENLYLLFAVLLLGGTTMLWSFGDGQAGNLMFDGGSICAQPPYIRFLFSLNPC